MPKALFTRSECALPTVDKCCTTCNSSLLSRLRPRVLQHGREKPDSSLWSLVVLHTLTSQFRRRRWLECNRIADVSPAVHIARTVFHEAHLKTSMCAVQCYIANLRHQVSYKCAYCCCVLFHNWLKLEKEDESPQYVKLCVTILWTTYSPIGCSVDQCKHSITTHNYFQMFTFIYFNVNKYISYRPFNRQANFMCIADVNIKEIQCFT